MDKVNIFWFRRDLRLHDNHGLFQALTSGEVLPVFILDTQILNQLDNKNDLRITFIYKEIEQLKHQLEKIGSTLIVLHQTPLDAFIWIQKRFSIKALYFNHDYEPYATGRDKAIYKYFNNKNIPVYSFKDQVIFEKNDILKPDLSPYTVFTPYSKKWKEKFNNQNIVNYHSEKLLNNFYKTHPEKLLSIDDLGFKKTKDNFPEKTIDIKLIENYHQTRDYPSVKGTSRLGVHLRFGTISIRNLIKIAAKTNEVFLNELIWREFYMMILWHFPSVIDQSFKKKYDRIEWRNNENEFNAWCNGKTGYPIVDAGMQELNKTGFMHNRLRMITASFLTRHLLIDWRWGEAYFAEKLLDYELASNNGGWQWAAGTGCDAAPYFRIFNPELQTKKFDPQLKYIKKWITEPGSSDNNKKPIVDHKFARERALKTYKKALNT